jgi:uncharacterized protein YjbI with pentapeptide repeats
VTPDEPLELRNREFREERIAGVELPPRSEVVDTTLTGCDLAGLLARESRLERVTLTDTRLRGVTWGAGVVRDVTLESVTGDDVSVRFSSLRRVQFLDCRLAGLDLTEATLDDVGFERCDLRGARFDHVKVKKLRIAGCDLTGASGATALAGATLQLDDLLSLAPSLARDLGITVE